MSRVIKFKNNDYLDSSSIAHNRAPLKNILTTELFNEISVAIGYTVGGKIMTKDSLGNVYLKANISINSGTIPIGYIKLFTIPSNVRPKETIYYPCINNNGVFALGRIDISGDVYGYMHQTGNTMFHISVAYNIN